MSITLIIVVVTSLVSMVAFSNRQLFDRLMFWPYSIWRNNEWYRLITCGFIHADAGHLIFNMIALYSFGAYMEQAFSALFGSKGIPLYLFMYFLAIATADIYNLFMRKDDYAYRSIGASGGISAIVFSYVLLNPFGKIGFLFLPPQAGIYACIFGPLYLLYCIYMARKANDHIAHWAHFTGSIIGFVFPILFEPKLFTIFINQVLSGGSLQ